MGRIRLNTLAALGRPEEAKALREKYGIKELARMSVVVG